MRNLFVRSRGAVQLIVAAKLMVETLADKGRSALASTPDTDNRRWSQLLPALRRLDARLEHAVRQARAAYAQARAGEHFRGLYVSDDDVDSLLARQPGEPLLHVGHLSGDYEQGRLDVLRRAFGLSSFDIDVILLALAPELDRRYERLYGYLQDNVSLRRPTTDLALHLLCAGAD